MVFKQARFHRKKRSRVLPVAADLEARVAEALATAPHLDGTAITVTALGNCMVLKGFVTSPEERERATEQAGAVDGVGEIDNQIQIR